MHVTDFVLLIFKDNKFIKLNIINPKNECDSDQCIYMCRSRNERDEGSLLKTHPLLSAPAN